MIREMKIADTTSFHKRQKLKSLAKPGTNKAVRANELLNTPCWDQSLNLGE
jgi:hypothetical protein